MAARKKREYTCTAIYTEGCEQRLTQALVDIYYNRISYRRYPVCPGNMVRVDGRISI